MGRSSSHIRTLDGARGFAVLLVMVFHMTVLRPTGLGGRLLFALTSGGWAGVDLFFVLSGTLITGILLDTKGRQGYFANFYVRRALRIWPLYYALLAFAFFVLPSLPGVPLTKLPEFKGGADIQGWYWTFLQNYAIAAVGRYRDPAIDVTWSLAIEEQFYLAWPVLVLLLSRRSLTRALIALIVASALLRLALVAGGWSPISVYVFTPDRLESLCVGALLAIAMRSEVEGRLLAAASRAGLAIGGLAVAVLAVATGGFDYTNPYVQTVGYLAVALLFGGFIAAAIRADGTGSLLDRALTSRPLRAFGLYSYAMYLMHLPIRAALRDRVLRPATFGAYPGGEVVGQLVFYGVAIAITFVMGALSYHLFEKHVLRLKSVFAAWGARRRPDVAATTPALSD